MLAIDHAKLTSFGPWLVKDRLLGRPRAAAQRAVLEEAGSKGNEPSYFNRAKADPPALWPV